MIYLSACDLLFLKPRKVAGTSFEIALSRHAKAGDIITPVSKVDERARRQMGYRHAQNFSYDFKEIIADRKKLWTLMSKQRLPRKFYNHIPAACVREYLGQDTFDKALKVSIVRNPFDLLVSKYYWSVKKTSNPPDFQVWLEDERMMNFAKKNDQQYFIGNQLIVDHLIRYEFFHEDILGLETVRPSLAGLGSVFSGIRAKGGHRPARANTAEHYAGRPDLVEAILKRYRWVFDRFDYPAP